MYMLKYPVYPLRFLGYVDRQTFMFILRIIEHFSGGEFFSRQFSGAIFSLKEGGSFLGGRIATIDLLRTLFSHFISE